MPKQLAAAIALLTCAPVLADIVAFDNIAPNNGIHYNGFSTTSQLNHTFDFDAGVADDFSLDPSTDISGDWQINRVDFSGVFILGKPATNVYFNMIFWPQDTLQTKPAGSTAAGLPPDYSSALAVYSHIPATSTLNDSGVNTYDYSANLPTPFLASHDTPYWLEIQADMNWPPQWAWQVVLGTQGEITYNGFAGLLDQISFWSEGGLDTAFTLYGDAVPEPTSAGLLLMLGLLCCRHQRPRR